MARHLQPSEAVVGAVDSALAIQRPVVGRRLLALLLDYCVILAWMAVLGVFSLLLFLLTGSAPDTLGLFGPVGSQALFFFLLTFVVGVYLYRTESGPRHATWGKRWMGLQVAAVGGSAPSSHQILVRTVVKLLPWEVAHTFVWQMMWMFYQHGYDYDVPFWIFLGQQAATVAAVVYIVMVIATRRGPHDRAAGTVVESADRQAVGWSSPRSSAGLR